ncbi:MAG: hypothetical protein A2X94_16150 [Bdellovibrionales bacterium GWB1_55_8]|nr:MAG: hypothetical protein A2X94_16150 [Bdellovibrionales bacterium GWB1_55_8]
MMFRTALFFSVCAWVSVPGRAALAASQSGRVPFNELGSYEVTGLLKTERGALVSILEIHAGSNDQQFVILEALKAEDAIGYDKMSVKLEIEVCRLATSDSHARARVLKKPSAAVDVPPGKEAVKRIPTSGKEKREPCSE